MNWERDPLLAKSRLFFERAFDHSRDEPLFGLWCSLGLELLERAALASVSPTLLAEQDRDHKHLLYALGRASIRHNPRSIGAAKVFDLCKTLFDEFSDENLTSAVVLCSRRNEELHSGVDAFGDYPTKMWLPGFYRACTSLTAVLGETMETLFGKDEADAADEMLTAVFEGVKSSVSSTVAAHKKVFESKSPKEQEAARVSAEGKGEELAYKRHHRVTCPACECVATVQGHPFGRERVITTDVDAEITLHKAVSPRSFECSACELKLNGYAELDAAGLGGQYTRTTTVTPEEYYDLLDPATMNPWDHISDDEIRDYLSRDEYDNE